MCEPVRMLCCWFAGSPVGVDGASAGYKKFADKVKALAQVGVA